MVADNALDTINNVVDPLAAVAPVKSRTKSSNVADPLAAIAPVKSRTNSSHVALPLTAVVPIEDRTPTAVSSCSIATEQGGQESLQSRDVATVETRGEDGARDSVADDVTFNEKSASVDESTVTSKKGCSCSPLPLLTRAGDHIDAALKQTGENIDAAVQSFYSSLEAGAENMVASYMPSAPCCQPLSPASGGKGSSPAGTDEAAPAADDLLAATQTAESKNSVPEPKPMKKERSQTAESKSSVPEPKPMKKERSEISLKSQQSNVKIAKSRDTIKSEKNDTAKSIKTQGSTESIKTQGTTKSIKTEGTAKSSPDNVPPNITANGSLTSLQAENEAKVQPSTKAQSGCCFMSVFTCAGDDQEGSEQAVETELKNVPDVVSEEAEVPPSTLDESSKVHILDTFSEDNTSESCKQQTGAEFVTPRAKYLLEEIEDIENSLFEVRKTASVEEIGKIKKRQDPFIQRMATIKQHLLDQQALLQSAPEDTKKDYYRAISHAAMLNAEVETRRAELELKKIRLESMRVEEEMDRMMVIDDSLDDTFDSLDQSLMTKESQDGVQRAFDVFARYTANKFHKMRRKKGRT